MSNTPVNNRPDPSRPVRLRVDVQSHRVEDPHPSRPEEILPEDFAARIASAVRATAHLRAVRSGHIEVAVVTDDQIHAVNRQHLGHDWETDVISFPYHRSDDAVEGELLISWETAVRQSRRTLWPAMTELLLYAIHGTLHLTGMDDADDQGRGEMRRLERTVLETLRPPGYDRYDLDRR